MRLVVQTLAAGLLGGSLLLGCAQSTSSGGGAVDLSFATEFEMQQANNAFNIAFNALTFAAGSVDGVTSEGTSTGTNPTTVDYVITFTDYDDYISDELVNGTMTLTGTYVLNGTHDFYESGTLTFGGDGAVTVEFDIHSTSTTDSGTVTVNGKRFTFTTQLAQ